MCLLAQEIDNRHPILDFYVPFLANKGSYYYLLNLIAKNIAIMVINSLG